MKFNGISDALVGMASKIYQEGIDVKAPKGSWREVLNNTVTIEHPLQRHLTVLNRNNNLVACIVESMWVLSGSNELSVINPYLPRAVEFSDDGLTWRAGYGKRLRHFGETNTDQLEYVYELLKRDPTSRQAVLAIYDPDEDSGVLATKDIPCNNWVSFHIAEGTLYMAVAIRSNDLVWGWSGINMFEWSIVHQLLAESLGIKVGSVTYLQSNLHMYEHYFTRYCEKPYQLIYPDPTLNLPLGFTIENMDRVLAEFFRVIRLWEVGRFTEEPSTDLIPAGTVLALYLKFIKLHWLAKLVGQSSGDYQKELGTFLQNPASDFKQAVRLHLKDFTPEEKQALTTKSAKPLSELLADVKELHHAKGLVYGNSWCKHGEQLSILPNILRKLDRLVKFTSLSPKDRIEALKAEDIYDTLVDLFVYLGKYQIWLSDGCEVTVDHEAKFASLLSSLLQEYPQDCIHITDFDLEYQGIALDFEDFTSCKDNWSGTRKIERVHSILLRVLRVLAQLPKKGM